MRPRSIFTRSCLLLFALLVLARVGTAEPAMWVIKDKDSTIYLFGTIHFLRSDTVWQTPKIRSALGESTELWLEIANLDGDITSLLGKHGLDPKKPLSSRLKPEQNERVRKLAEKYTFPAHLLEPMKPWYAALTLGMLPLFKAGYNPNAGVDMYLSVQARAERDKIAGLESAEEQLQMMAGLSEAEQISYLMEILDTEEEGLAELDALVRSWVDGDLEQLGQKLLDEMKRDAPSLYERIFVARNRRWTKQLAKMLKRSGVQFVAVGAGHLVGKDGVPEMLRKQGIKAERH